MHRIRIFAMTLVVALSVCASAVAQSTTPASSNPSTSALSSDQPKAGVATRIKTWAQTKWEALRRKIKADHEQYLACARQLDEQQLDTRDSLRFLHECLNPKDHPRITSEQAPPSATSKVGSWTRAQWEKLRRRLREDRQRWNECLKQREGRKLSPHSTTHFMYDCMLKRNTRQ